ncbi:hypothetical protein OHV05_34575 [Kitasatospora sp. NBC_00070]|uniref:hypothetical protein n=1 Tax=Kitasatospora sp. NBC_00070 TaxID=2975962 RepID=UPI003243FDA8
MTGLGVGVGLGFGGAGGAQAAVDPPGQDGAGHVQACQGAFAVGGDDPPGDEPDALGAAKGVGDRGERVVGDEQLGGLVEGVAGGCGVALAGGPLGGVGVLGGELPDTPGAFLLLADRLPGGGPEAAVGGDAQQGLVQALVVLEGDHRASPRTRLIPPMLAG